MDLLLSAASASFTPVTVAAILLGSIFGVIFGSIPGLTFTVAMALAVPLTFSLDQSAAIGLMLGTYIGGMTGGSVSSILLGVPGTPSAAATVLDGYPLAKKGQASLALGMAVAASAFGGIISLIVMVVSVDLVASLAMNFGPAETFALLIFGLSTICGLSEGSLVRGFIAGILGLMVMTVGVDAMDGVRRMTFGTVTLQQGINLLVAMLALFAVPHIIDAFVRHFQEERTTKQVKAVGVELPRLRDLGRNFWLMVRCSLMGTGIGAIPGTGGPVAAFLAYAHARKTSKNPQEFGKGSVEGVVAPESANNAVTGGAMIPLLSLGIPGDPGTALLLSALLIHGLVPGPMLFIESPDAIYGIYIAIILAYLFVCAFQVAGIRFFVQLLKVPPHVLAVAIVIMCGFGAYSVRNSVFDIYTVAILGAGAYGLMRARIPLTPIILGVVLGPAIERDFRTAMILSDGDLSVFFSSAPAILFMGLTILIVGTQVGRSLISSFSPKTPGIGRNAPVSSEK